MHRRTGSAAALAGDGEQLTVSRLPPRSPAASIHGLRTPPTCPASPLLGVFAHGPGAVSPLAAAGCAPSRGSGSGGTPGHSRRGSVSCQALPFDLPQQSHVLPGIVTSVFESNITAAQCYSAYPAARMHNAPPLVGRGDSHHHHHSHIAAAAGSGGQARAGVVAHSHAHSTMGGLLGPTAGGGHLLDDINDMDFGLAACLATPLDPGPGLERRLAPLPATTTGAAARTAAAKLTSANDILNEASRYGDWVRRQRRRKRLERMQGALAELGGHAALGMLLDDTLHDYGPRTASTPASTLSLSLTGTRREGDGGVAAAAAAAAPQQRLGGGEEGGGGCLPDREAEREQERLMVAALKGAVAGMVVEAAGQQVEERRARRVLLQALLDQSAGCGVRGSESDEDDCRTGGPGRRGKTGAQTAGCSSTSNENEEEEEFPARFPGFRDDMAFINS